MALDPLTATLVAEALRGLKAGISWFVQRRAGNRQGAIDAIRAYQSNPIGQASKLDDDILQAVQLGAAGLYIIEARGMVVDEALTLFQLAEMEDNRDLTDEEVQAFLDGTLAAADTVEEKLRALEAEQGAETETEPATPTPETPPGATGAETVPQINPAEPQN